MHFSHWIPALSQVTRPLVPPFVPRLSARARRPSLLGGGGGGGAGAELTSRHLLDKGFWAYLYLRCLLRTYLNVRIYFIFACMNYFMLRLLFIKYQQTVIASAGGGRTMVR